MAILGCLLAGDIYVYDMQRRTGFGSGVIHTALARLERCGMVWSDWADQPGGLPRRRRYGLARSAVDAIVREYRHE